MTRKTYRCKKCGLTGTKQLEVFQHSCTEALIEVSEDAGVTFRDYSVTEDWRT